jgi:hypothetical protein
LKLGADLEFNAQEWQQLEPSERVRRCLAFAAHARELSAEAAPELKQSYLDLSQHWLALAEEMDRYASESGQSSARLQPGAL